MIARRDFLRSSLVLGTWTLTWATPVVATPAGGVDVDRATGLPVWLRFADDGTLTVLSYVNEMGQGTHTGVAQIAAEELDMSIAAVRVAQAPLAARFVSRRLKNYATFGSLGLRLSHRELAPACAAARDMLVRAAAMRWGVDPSACRTRDAHVVHPDRAQRLPYAALLASAARLSPPATPTVKPREAWTVIGRSVARVDVPAKVDGSAVFGIDVRRPGMLVATVMHAPRFGDTLDAVDERAALAVSGVKQVVTLPHAVAVVATGYWAATKGLRALSPTWRAAPRPPLDSRQISALLRAAVARGEGRDFAPAMDARLAPDRVAAALAGPGRVVDVTYEVPFLAHATMEPMNAVADVRPSGAELWLSTQTPQDTQRGVAKALGLQPEQVTVHGQLVGGGFGRRLEHGFAIEAALIAKAVGQPVQMIWSRETDMRAGGYRPAAAARVRLVLGDDGLPQALRADLANSSLLEYTGLTINGPANGMDWTATMGWLGHDYDIPAQQLTWTRVDPGVSCGFWRSVGASQNVFFYECSIDRAAALAGIDPLDYRLRLLATRPRVQAMLRALAARAGWGTPLPAGRFRGLAMSAGNDARSAHVVEVSVPAAGKFRIERIVTVVDAGVVFNPSAVEAQLFGGTIFGLSAALHGEITFEGGAVVQGNFDSYRLLTLAETPPIEVIVLGNGDRPLGVGEEGVASIAPALANALFAATGRPVTQLPLSRAGWALAT